MFLYIPDERNLDKVRIRVNPWQVRRATHGFPAVVICSGCLEPMEFPRGVNLNEILDVFESGRFMYHDDACEERRRRGQAALTLSVRGRYMRRMQRRRR